MCQLSCWRSHRDGLPAVLRIGCLGQKLLVMGHLVCVEQAAILVQLRAHGATSECATIFLVDSPLPVPAVERLLGTSDAMAELRATIERVAPHRTTVLITGESGTGKELVARAIHEASPRHGNRFIAINCAAIAPTLLESELFGYVRGAFTDAQRDHVGLFEEADGGTIFLDEIAEIPTSLQAKLLRVLQESEVRRVGATVSTKIDVRVVAASLRDIAADVVSGRFREDLYYRLNVVPIVVPSLRDRPTDIPLLAQHFAILQSAKHRRFATWEPQALALLEARSWPGNVRELENLVERATVLADGSQITAEFLQTLLGQKNLAIPGRDIGEDQFSIKKATRLLEAGLIRKALSATAGNRTNAAKLLEISHRALLYKIKEYGIARSENLDK